MSTFEYYAEYYDLLYRDKDYPREAAFVRDVIEQHRPGARKILELGCGTGLHAALLAEAGYSVRGVDRSREMVDRAAARRMTLAADVSERLSFEQADIRHYPAIEEYDAAVSLFHVISYQTGNDDILRAFSVARRSLTRGGVFLFDCWYGPAVLHQRPEARVKRWEDDAFRIVRVAEPVWHPNANSVDVNYHIIAFDKARGGHSEVHETHTMRYLFLPEIELLLSSARMSLVSCGEWLSGRDLGPETWNAYFVARPA